MDRDCHHRHPVVLDDGLAGDGATTTHLSQLVLQARPRGDEQLPLFLTQEGEDTERQEEVKNQQGGDRPK